MTCLDCSPSRLKLGAFAKKFRQTVNLMVGQPDYENYVAHTAQRPPGPDADDADRVFPQSRGPAIWRWQQRRIPLLLMRDKRPSPRWRRWRGEGWGEGRVISQC